jgi:hypothetical protein
MVSTALVYVCKTTHYFLFFLGAWAVSQFDWVFPCLVQNNTQQLPFSSLLYARVITTATTSMSKAVPASHLEIDMLLVAWKTCFLQLYSAWFPLKIHFDVAVGR